MIFVEPLHVVKSEAGKVIKLHSGAVPTLDFDGEVYVSNMRCNHINAWKMNKKQAQNLVVLRGSVWIVVATSETTNSTQEFEKYFASSEVYQRIVIPPRRYYGFVSRSLGGCEILNMLSERYSENDNIRAHQSIFDFDWQECNA